MTAHTISYFKNHALQILDAVAAKGEELVVTRRGKPLAHIGPIASNKATELGKLKGTMEIRDNIVTPLGDDDWTVCR